MVTIYGVYRSRALRPLWVLAEAGCAFDHVPVIQAARLAEPQAADAPLNTRSPDYLTINPLGQIPAMRDGTLLLSESLAICLHLARKYGRDLGPQNDDETALLDQWALFAATAIEPPALEIMLTATDNLDRSATAEAILRLCAEKLRAPLKRLELALSEGDYLLGRFSVADIVMVGCLRYAEAYPAIFDDFPRSKAWLAACQSRPAFRAVLAKREAEPA